jgi:hypothetical protein
MFVVSFRGGPPVMVTDTLAGTSGAAWSPDGFINSDASGPRPLVRISPTGGGKTEWFTTLDSARGEGAHTFP